MKPVTIGPHHGLITSLTMELTQMWLAVISIEIRLSSM